MDENNTTQSLLDFLGGAAQTATTYLQNQNQPKPVAVNPNANRRRTDWAPIAIIGGVVLAVVVVIAVLAGRR